MVADGIYYALALSAGGALVAWLTRPWFGLPLFVLALFCLYFFRDPERSIPAGRVAVSPADGKVVAVRTESPAVTRVSIFLNIFDVHVNRTPISGKITDVEYHKGQFLVASKEEASAQNEQNTITVEGDGTRVRFKQIAGLIARRIVTFVNEGESVGVGQRVGLIRFGSRVDLYLPPGHGALVAVGQRAVGGETVMADLKSSEPEREARAQ
jgi:phosphatidylserine decarboxylase